MNDYMLLKEVKIVFVPQETFSGLGSAYRYRYPCIFLRPSVYGGGSGGVKKVPAGHHEAVKIRSRLHRLPEALEQMTAWRLPPLPAEEVPDDLLLARLSNPDVQIDLLKRLKRW